MSHTTPIDIDGRTEPGPVDLAGHDIERMQAVQAFNAKLVCMTVDESSFPEVVRGVWKVIGCDACALFLVDGGDLVLKAAIGYEGLPADLRISCEDLASVHAQAFSEEYLVHLDDLQLVPGVTALSAEMRSNLVLPVISKRGPVGVFDFGSRRPGAFDDRVIGMSSMLIDQMAYSLENIRLVRELSNSRDAVIRGMALLSEIRDSHIGGHLNRICAMSRLLAERLAEIPGGPAVSPSFIDTIERAAALHDVGKVGIPDAILLKPGKLTSAEFEVMKSHTVMGADILEGLIEDFGSYEMIYMGAEVAASHHEWWDGSGYPRGLAGTEIPLAARIVALCDVCDALSSMRVYKDAWDQDRTIAKITELAGTQFDPLLARIFLDDPQTFLAIHRRFPD